MYIGLESTSIPIDVPSSYGRSSDHSEYSVYFSSLPLLKGSEISLLSYIDPLTAMLISAFVLSEPTTLLQIAGGVLILGSTLFSELTKK